MPLAPNTRLGTYEILGPLGAGGMGEIYLSANVRSLHGDPRWGAFMNKVGFER